MGGTTRRLRVALAEHYTVALVAVLLVGAVGGSLVYTTHVDPGTTTETRQVSSWTSESEFGHRATVVNGSAAFETGTVLRNRTVYFRGATPRLNGSFRYGYTATDGGDLAVNATTMLVLRSVGTRANGNETVYWTVRRPLGQRAVESVGPGERVSVPFSVNVSAAQTEARRIDERLGGTPGEIELAVVARLDVTGTRNGQPVDTAGQHRLSIQPQQGVYRVRDPGPTQTSGEQTETVSVPVEYGPLRRLGGPLLLLASLAGLVGLVGGRRSGWLRLDDDERERLAYRRTRAEFDEWISTGRVRRALRDGQAIELDSLSGLVDVAIDTDSRVIEDREAGHCLVRDGDQWYRFEMPPNVTDGSARNGHDSGDSAEVLEGVRAVIGGDDREE